MTRRNPLAEQPDSAYFANIVGLNTLIPATSGCVMEPQSVTIAAGATGGSGVLSSNGVPIGSISYPANDTTTFDFADNYELALGSGLQINMSAAADVTVYWVCQNEETPIAKYTARASTYGAYVAAANAKRKAIRRPNRFGGQVEG